MKTIKQWFELLPEPTRKLALERAAEASNLNVPALTFASALDKAFIWDSTDEGSSFWKAVWDYCIEQEVSEAYLYSISSR